MPVGQSTYNPLVSQLGKATRGFVHILGFLSCLGRFGQTSSHLILKQGTHKPLVAGLPAVAGSGRRAALLPSLNPADPLCWAESPDARMT